MLKAMFVKTGKTVDFSEMTPEEAVKEIVIGEDVTLYMADSVVLFRGTTVAAMDCFDPVIGIKRDVSAELQKKLMTLAIDDTASYDGIEEFFADFPVRFIP